MVDYQRTVFRCSAVFELEFVDAVSVDAAQAVFDCWLDLVGEVLPARVRFDEVGGTEIREEFV